MKKILITGSSGFIGFHLAKNLSKTYTVIGLDNHNSYYSKKIKKKRLSILRKNKIFFFKKIDLKNKKEVEKIFKKFKPQIVFHIAGQPGVLYSFKNPKSYKLNNTLTTNILSNLCKRNKIEKFIFASSSSVYGDQKKFPIKETFKTNPKNPYARTKIESEQIIFKNLKKSKTDFLIFRFFTVYGSFGRPDMFIHKFLNSIKNKKLIKLHNKGMNFRDFTYIDDVVSILKKSINKKISKKILNICRSKPILTLDLVKMILKTYGVKKANLKETKFVKGEMLKTHGSNMNLKKYFGKIKFTDIKKGIKYTIRDYKLHKM